MHPAELPLHRRWFYALKPGGWPKLLVAAALGHGIGIASAGRIDLVALALGAVFTMLHLAFVVLVNDWGDRDVDEIKRRLYPDQCSPKTIPDDVLDERSVLLGGTGAAALALGVAGLAEHLLARPGLLLGGAACLLLLVLYTLPPVRLNYRGGGEVLEMLGAGFFLPWWNAYVQGGQAMPAGMVVLPSFALLCLASALASGLADEESDRLGGKRTFTTSFGPIAVRQAADGLVIGAMLVWAALPWLAPYHAQVWMVLPVVVVMVSDYRELVSEGRHLGDPMHRRYKELLHQCIWRGGLMMAAMLAIAGLLSGGIGGGGIGCGGIGSG
ncbi:UbiA family prenyltransferase [Paraliomyxa miuraensis]|uniref:UbiA family prenyltransferase n=1 Tax=Paraliomyxa miuraensis TaxID=376150 RepID=UPI00224FE38E|nr:UbiA family prenyltransferase [Paraliomyxa miuraensis]MCX4243517.1 UbiA family prenyltransferase [Paraliomyxa miuraensis]